MASNQFTALSSFMSRRAPAIFGHSEEYGPVSTHLLDEALIVGDRIVAACLGRPEFTKIGDVLAPLIEVAKFEDEGRIDESWKSAGRWVQHNAEHWLKAILWIVDSAVYNDLQQQADEARSQRKNARFNLFEAYIRLSLLTKSEANSPKPEEIGDPVRRNFRAAQDCRNEGHDPGGLPDRRDVDLAITLFLGPLLKWRQTVREVLTGLVSRPLELEDTALQTLRTVAEVQRNHVDRFGGREYWLQRCSEHVAKLRETGGYLVLTGPEGQGKSALLAKLADRFASHDRLLGSDGPKVQRDAPWLPGVLLHFGKQSARIDEIVTLLIAQANSQLIRRVPPSLMSVSPLQTQIDPQTFRGADNLGTSFEDPPHGGDRPRQPRRDGLAQDPINLYNRALHSALERLVEERGQSILILDALDEITRDGAQLAFLPEPVPKGAVVLVTTRPNLKLDLWLKLNRTNVEILSLDSLTREETPLLTRVDDSQSDRARRFNDEAFRRTRGWAYVLASIGREVDRANGSFESVSLSGIAENLLERQVEDWTRSGSDRSLHACLILLAVFEPCCPLSVDEIQGYLIHECGAGLTRAQTVTLLRGVGPQVEGLASGRVKLAQSIFAQHIRSPYLSSRDLNTALTSIACWLGQDVAVSAETIAAFVTAPRVLGEPPIPPHVNEGIATALKSRNAAVTLTEIGLSAIKKPDGSAVGLKFLTVAADLDESRALRELGTRYIDGREVVADSDLGLEYLSRSAENGDIVALLALAMRLLDGRGVVADVVAGERWLRRAADTGDPRALASLGVRLLFGDRLIPDRSTGMGLLRAAFAKEPSFAVLLATLLIDGPEEYRDEEHGIRLLRNAASNHDAAAMTSLAQRLFDALGIAQDETEGRRLLVEAAEGGDVRAMIILGERLVSGRGVTQDAPAGESWLRRAIDGGSGAATIALARQFLPGGQLPPNELAALEILKKASERGVRRAKRDLGRRLLDGNGVSKNRSEGTRLMEELVADADIDAMFQFGEWLVRQPSSVDSSKGEQYLRRASHAGSDAATSALIVHLLSQDGTRSEGEAMLRREASARDQYRVRELSERLVNGDRIAADLDEATQLLRTGADQGFVEPMIALAMFIESNEIPATTVGEAIHWLRVATALGDSEAAQLLARRLLDDPSQTLRAEGRDRLVKLADRGSAGAIVELAGRLCDGRGMPRDETLGRELFDRGLRLSMPGPMLELARRLLDGDGLSRNSDEGLRILSALAARGDRKAQVDLGHRLVSGDGVPRDRDAGLRVLSVAIETGSLAASTLLGQLLVEGKDLSQDVEAGEKLLRQAADKGGKQAMTLLGSRLIDGSGGTLDPVSGRDYLVRATQSGHTTAMAELGTRLLDGRGLARDPQRGEHWLRTAARRGDAAAMVKLGERLIAGDGLTVDVSEGEWWLLRAGDLSPQSLIALGFSRFQRGQADAAISPFLRAFEAGSKNAGNNIAYMLRRGDIQPKQVPEPIDHYLENGLNTGEAFNLINLALCFAQGFQRQQDWWRADELVRSLRDSANELVDWWHSLAKHGDSEGDLVLGWLSRHGLIVDPESLSFSDRLSRAKHAGWAVPDWMFSAAQEVPPPEGM